MIGSALGNALAGGVASLAWSAQQRVNWPEYAKEFTLALEAAVRKANGWERASLPRELFENEVGFEKRVELTALRLEKLAGDIDTGAYPDDRSFVADLIEISANATRDPSETRAVLESFFGIMPDRNYYEGGGQPFIHLHEYSGRVRKIVTGGSKYYSAGPGTVGVIVTLHRPPVYISGAVDDLSFATSSLAEKIASVVEPGGAIEAALKVVEVGAMVLGGPVQFALAKAEEVAAGEAQAYFTRGAADAGYNDEMSRRLGTGLTIIGTVVLGASVAKAIDIARKAKASGLGAAKGAPVIETRGGTYVLRDADGAVVRSGRTKDLARRKAEHSRDDDLAGYKFDPVDRTDDYAQQHGLDQELYDQYSPPLNKIRPISPSNKKIDTYTDAAQKYLLEHGGP